MEKKKKTTHTQKNPFIFSLSCLSGEGEELPAKVQYILGKCIFQFWYMCGSSGGSQSFSQPQADTDYFNWSEG